MVTMTMNTVGSVLFDDAPPTPRIVEVRKFDTGECTINIGATCCVRLLAAEARELRDLLILEYGGRGSGK